MLEYERKPEDGAAVPSDKVRVIGIGGAGSNVLDRIALEGMDEAELMTLNTDVRALNTSVAHDKVQIGKNLTQGLGAGGDPELGFEAAREATEEIRNAVKGKSMVFVCAGLGGGTGSGAAPVVAQIARQEGAFVVGFVNMPFSFEGKRRIAQADTALAELEQVTNALVTFDNDRMGDLVLPKEGIQQAFAAADQIISQSIRAITKMVAQPGLVRIGMDDLLTALKNNSSRCLFGYGQAKGENRAAEALKSALKSPLLDKGRMLDQAYSLVAHICGGADMTLFEAETLMNELAKHVNDEAHILFGVASDKAQGENLSVTIVSSVGGKPAAAVPVTQVPAAAPEPEPAPTPEPAPAPAAVEEVAPPATAKAAAAVAAASAPGTLAAAAADLAATEPEPLLDPEPEPEPLLAEEPEPEPEPAVVAEPAPEPEPVAVEEPEFEPELIDVEELDPEPAADIPPAIEPEPARVPKPEPVAYEPVPVEPIEEDLPDPMIDEKAESAPEPQVQEELIPKKKAKGRFEQAEPTIVDGEDLDVPSFLRKKKRKK